MNDLLCVLLIDPFPEEEKMFKKTATTKAQNTEKHDKVIATSYFILFLGFFYNTSPFHPGTSSYKKKCKGRTSGRETYNHITIIITII